MRVDRLEPTFVDTIPATLEEGVVYISVPYRTASHLCACGCGRRIATPIRPSPRGWTIAYDGDNVSLHPSVGLLKLPCRSHYIVDRGRVVWLPYEDAIDDLGALTHRGRTLWSALRGSATAIWHWMTGALALRPHQREGSRGHKSHT